MLFIFSCGTDDVDTRAITRRLREDGSLIGVLSTEKSKTDEQLLEMSRTWNIVGKWSFLEFAKWAGWERVKTNNLFKKKN